MASNETTNAPVTANAQVFSREDAPARDSQTRECGQELAVSKLAWFRRVAIPLPFHLRFSAFICGLIVFPGCAQFTTTQTDVSPERTITTKATAWTFATSRSALANFKASQTDKTQSATVGALTQESSTTNLAANLDAMTRFIHALRPTP